MPGKPARQLGQSDKELPALCLQENWRKQKGIDSRVRRKFKGCGVIQPNIGYGSNRKTRHMLPSGEVLVHCFLCDTIVASYGRREGVGGGGGLTIAAVLMGGVVELVCKGDAESKAVFL